MTPEEINLTPEEIVESLRACAGVGSECKRCTLTVGYGCARDLKIKAAALIEKWNKERDELFGKNE